MSSIKRKKQKWNDFIIYILNKKAERDYIYVKEKW